MRPLLNNNKKHHASYVVVLMNGIKKPIKMPGDSSGLLKGLLSGHKMNSTHTFLLSVFFLVTYAPEVSK